MKYCIRCVNTHFTFLYEFSETHRVLKKKINGSRLKLPFFFLTFNKFKINCISILVNVMHITHDGAGGQHFS